MPVDSIASLLCLGGRNIHYKSTNISDSNIFEPSPSLCAPIIICHHPYQRFLQKHV